MQDADILRTLAGAKSAELKVSSVQTVLAAVIQACLSGDISCFIVLKFYFF